MLAGGLRDSGRRPERQRGSLLVSADALAGMDQHLADHLTDGGDVARLAGGLDAVPDDLLASPDLVDGMVGMDRVHGDCLVLFLDTRRFERQGPPAGCRPLARDRSSAVRDLFVEGAVLTGTALP